VPKDSHPGSRRWRTRPTDLVAETLSDETLVIDTASGVFFSLRALASTLWTILERGASAGELHAAVTDRFGEVPGVDADIASFVSALEADGLVVDGTTAELGASRTAPVWPDRYTAPIVKKYDDMADLLLVDPIHDVAADQGWPNKERDGS
jgi:hypothetical protein